MIALRISRSWNQNGQKHAGNPDIAKGVLPVHNSLLWLLVILTYLNTIRQLSRKIAPRLSREGPSAASFVLGVTAFTFKVAFVKEDAPELLDRMPISDLSLFGRLSMAAQARMVFTGLVLMMALASIPRMFSSPTEGSKASGTRPSHLKEYARILKISKSRRFLPLPRPSHTVSHHAVSGHQCSPFSDV